MDGRGCTICGTDCEELEPGFRRPDAVFAVPEEERAGRVRDSDDLVSVDDQAFFIRCVAPAPVIGREEQLDEVREDGWWSGTLDDHPYVPGPIDLGSRVWLRPAHVLAHARPQPPAPQVAPGPSLPERVRRWLRGRGSG